MKYLVAFGSMRVPCTSKKDAISYAKELYEMEKENMADFGQRPRGAYVYETDKHGKSTTCIGQPED